MKLKTLNSYCHVQCYNVEILEIFSKLRWSVMWTIYRHLSGFKEWIKIDCLKGLNSCSKEITLTLLSSWCLMCNNSGGSKIGIILDDKSSFSPRAAITESHLASPHQPDFILELGVNVNQAAFVVSGPVTGSSLFSEWEILSRSDTNNCNYCVARLSASKSGSFFCQVSAKLSKLWFQNLTEFIKSA